MCLFCEQYKNRDGIVMENETCFAVYERNEPTNHGHMLILTKEHKETYFDLSYKEHEDMNILLNNCRSVLDKELDPDGYNIGFNIGRWGGQSVPHCHSHLIPRFAGDVPATELYGGVKNFKKPYRESIKK